MATQSQPRRLLRARVSLYWWAIATLCTASALVHQLLAPVIRTGDADTARSDQPLLVASSELSQQGGGHDMGMAPPPALPAMRTEESSTTRSNENSTTSPKSSVFTCSVNNEVVSIPVAPHFIIPGVQKGGTTALYHFLNEHPNVQGSLNGEPHFFDWHYPTKKNTRRWLKARNMSLESSREDIECMIKKKYRDCFNVSQDSPPGGTVFFEKTPNYLALRGIPKKIVATCHWKPKIVVVLRNPVTRAFSHYAMQHHDRMPLGVRGKSFEELIDMEIASLKNIGLSNAPNRTSNYTIKDDNSFAVPSLGEGELNLMLWKHQRRLKLTNFLQRGMYALLLQPWIEYFPLGESMIIVSHERLSSHPEEVFSQILEFVGVPPFTPSQGFTTKRKQRNKQIISESARQYLTAFFRPYNELLADMLGDEWRGIWDYE